MHIPVSAGLLRVQNYDAALREACDQLSRQGIRNFIHYGYPRSVELLDWKFSVVPVVDHKAHSIIFSITLGCGYQSNTGSYPSPPIHFAASH